MRPFKEDVENINRILRNKLSKVANQAEDLPFAPADINSWLVRNVFPLYSKADSNGFYIDPKVSKRTRM